MSTGSNPYDDRAAKVSQPQSADDYTVVLVDEPRPHVRRITMNRPEKRNALNHALRGQVIHALQTGDADPEVHVMIVRGRRSLLLGGPTTSAGATRGRTIPSSRPEARDSGPVT